MSILKASIFHILGPLTEITLEILVEVCLPVMSKQALRNSLRKLLDGIDIQDVAHQSLVIDTILQKFVNETASSLGRPLNIGCYIGMEHQPEVQTLNFLKWSYQNQNLIDNIYLPRCTNTKETGQISLRDGKTSHVHLVFLNAKSWQNIKNMKPQGKYKLREPPMPESKQLQKPPKMDLMIVPGVGFNPVTGARTGWGAGYYDDFFQRYKLSHNNNLPVLLGVCLKEQLTQDIICEPHDQNMDYLLVGDSSLYKF